MEKTIIQIRPRFKLRVSQSPEEVMDKIQLLLRETPDHIRAKMVSNHIILSIVGEELHYWSPQLNFRVEADENEEGKTIIAGLIGPRPPVWTLFMLVYFSVGVAGLGASTYGFSKYMLNEYSPFLWGLPLAIIFMLSAYKAGKFGESLGKDQVDLLKAFIEKVVDF